MGTIKYLGQAIKWCPVGLSLFGESRTKSNKSIVLSLPDRVSRIDRVWNLWTELLVDTWHKGFREASEKNHVTWWDPPIGLRSYCADTRPSHWRTIGCTDVLGDNLDRRCWSIQDHLHQSSGPNIMCVWLNPNISAFLRTENLMPMEIDPIRHRSGSIFVPEKELQKELNKSNRNNAILRTIPTVATRDSKYKVANSEKCWFLPHFREPLYLLIKSIFIRL